MMINQSVIGLLSIVGGILGAVYLNQPSWFWLILFLSAFCMIIIRFILNRSLPGWLFLLCLFWLSGFWFSFNHQTYLQQYLINQNWSGKSIILEGIAVDQPVETEPGKFSMNLHVKPSSKAPGGKIVVAGLKKVSRKWYGRKLKVMGKFKISQSPKGFLPNFYEKRKITGRIWCDNEPVIVPGETLPWYFLGAYHLRCRMMAVGQKYLSPINQRFLHGMNFGEDLWDDGNEGILVDNLRKTGTIHLLTVSGMHIGFVVIGLSWLLGLLKIPKIWRFLVVSIGVWFYILMTGMEPPVLRAGIMLLLMLSAKLFSANEDYPNYLFLSAIILLLINPCNLFEVGFQLSFMATLGVVWLFPLLKGYLRVGELKKPVLRWVLEGLLVSISAQTLIIPILVYHFQQISWISPIINILLLFPANFIVLGGLIGELIGIIFPWLGQAFLLVVGWLIDLTRFGVVSFAQLPMAYSWVPRWPWPWIFGYYLGLALLLDGIRPSMITKKIRFKLAPALILLLIIGNLAVWGVYFYKQQGAFLEVSIIDVGQGDAILLKTPDGATALIDGGDEGAGKHKVLPKLRTDGIRYLDYVFITHGHRDHLGGMDEILEKIPEKRVYLSSKIDWESAMVKDFLIKLKQMNIPFQTVGNGTRLRLGKQVLLQIFNAPGKLQENDDSLVLKVEYCKKAILLTGDLSVKGEEILVQKYPHLLRASVLKVGHHGSNYSSMLPFLSQVKPRVAVISVGEGNRYGHPGTQTLNRLRSLGVHTLRTDQSGTIKIRLYQDRILIIPTERKF